MKYFSLLDWKNQDHFLCYKSLQFVSTQNETILTWPSSEYSMVVLRNFKFLSVLFLCDFVLKAKPVICVCIIYKVDDAVEGNITSSTLVFTQKGRLILKRKLFLSDGASTGKGNEKSIAFDYSQVQKFWMSLSTVQLVQHFWVQEANIYLKVNTWSWPM